MTIALGYKCLNGVVVAADTLVISSNDYEAQEGSKLSEFWVPCGSFAVVHASNDAHATVDLLGEIHHALESATPAGYRELGIIIKQQMKTWSDGFGRRKPPASSLVFAAKLKGLAAKLFRCDHLILSLSTTTIPLLGMARELPTLYTICFSGMTGESTLLFKPFLGALRI